MLVSLIYERPAPTVGVTCLHVCGTSLLEAHQAPQNRRNVEVNLRHKRVTPRNIQPASATGIYLAFISFIPYPIQPETRAQDVDKTAISMHITRPRRSMWIQTSCRSVVQLCFVFKHRYCQPQRLQLQIVCLQGTTRTGSVVALHRFMFDGRGSIKQSSDRCVWIGSLDNLSSFFLHKIEKCGGGGES